MKKTWALWTLIVYSLILFEGNTFAKNKFDNNIHVNNINFRLTENWFIKNSHRKNKLVINHVDQIATINFIQKKNGFKQLMLT